MTNRHMIHGHMHLVGDHLGIGSLVSLAMAAGTGEHRDLAGALHPHGAAFKPGAPAGLHEGRDTPPHQLTARPRRIALSDEFIVIGETYCLGERLLIVARAVFNPHTRFVRTLL